VGQYIMGQYLEDMVQYILWDNTLEIMTQYKYWIK
jgi:hypothetical protein